METGKLPPEAHYACREIAAERNRLRVENKRLRAKVDQLKKLAARRGARMQIMREHLVKLDEPHMDYGWRGFIANYCHPEADKWFDADGVPVSEEA